MKDLKKMAQECMRELDAIGIEYGEVVSWEVNTRAKQRWGQCRHLGGNCHSINISSRLLQDDVSDDGAKNTIIHELLHTVKGCDNHGLNWQREAEKVNRAYGYNIKRCSSAEEKGVPETEATPRTVKHKFVCECCGQIITRTRESNFTKNYKDYRCGRCGGHFIKEF